MTAESRDPAVNPNAMPIDVAAKVLAKADASVTQAMLRADLEAGAPANPDGTINLVHYAAWLAREAES
jgi:hypothetical protein